MLLLLIWNWFSFACLLLHHLAKIHFHRYNSIHFHNGCCFIVVYFAWLYSQQLRNRRWNHLNHRWRWLQFFHSQGCNPSKRYLSWANQLEWFGCFNVLAQLLFYSLIKFNFDFFSFPYCYRKFHFVLFLCLCYYAVNTRCLTQRPEPLGLPNGFDFALERTNGYFYLTIFLDWCFW